MTVSYEAQAYTYVSDGSEVLEAVRRLLASAESEAARLRLPKTTLGFDTETYGIRERRDKDDPYKPGLDPYSTAIRLMQFSSGREHLIIDVLHMSEEDLQAVFDVLTDKNVIKVIHNAKFDFKQVKNMYNVEIENMFCTMLASQILAAGIGCSHALKDVALRYVDALLDKAEQVSDWSADPLTPEQLDYASADTQILVKLYIEQRKRLTIQKLLPVAKLEFDCTKAAAWVEFNGIYLDEAMWMEIATKATERKNALEIELRDALDQGGKLPEFNLNSGKQLIEGLRLHGVELEDGASLKELAEHAGVEIVDRVIAYKIALAAHKKKLKDGLSEDSMEAHDSARELSTMAEELAYDFAVLLPKERINLGSNPQMLEALHAYGERFDLPELVELKGTNEKDHLGPCAHIELVAMLLEYREFSKAEGTYGETFLRFVHPVTGRIHPEFNTLRADTGRMSGSKPNPQNIPHADEYRACFLTPPVWFDGVKKVPVKTKLITADYSQIEPRILAELADDPAFHAVFTSGEDLYVSAAKIMFPHLLDEITEKGKKHPLRGVSKALMLGLFYGKGADALAADITAATGTECNGVQAKAHMKTFGDKFPIVWKWLGDAAKRAITERQTFTMMGRVRKIRMEGVTDHHVKEFYGPHKNRLYDDPDYSEAFRIIGGAGRQGKNTPIQGTSADITKMATVYLYNKYKWTDVRLINIVHDELVVEAPEDRAEEVAKEVEQLMIDAAKVFLKKVPVKVGVAIDDRWAKD